VLQDGDQMIRLDDQAVGVLEEDRLGARQQPGAGRMQGHLLALLQSRIKREGRDPAPLDPLPLRSSST
jgi:hypothetical protein